MDLQDLICSPFNDTEFIHVSNDIKLYRIISYSSLNNDDYDENRSISNLTCELLSTNSQFQFQKVLSS